MPKSTECVCQHCIQSDYTGKRWGDLIYPDYDVARSLLIGQCPYINRLMKQMDQIITDEDNILANRLIRTLKGIEP